MRPLRWEEDQQEKGPPSRKHIRCATLVILGVFLVLFFRLWQLQILEGESFERLSEKNRVRLRRVPFPRGIILDRNGRLLADNRASFNLMAVPAEIEDPSSTLERLSGRVQLEGEATVSTLIQARRRAPFRPMVLKKGLRWEEVAWVESNRLDLPGIWVEVEPRRWYPEGPKAAHVLGYVGEISEELLKSWRGKGYRVGDRVGRSGVERAMEPYLRGRDGGIQVEVDAKGRELGVLQEVSFEPGSDIVLTLDMGLQEVAEEALGDRAGAVVAGDPRTGAILAMVSHPSFDPNVFSEGVSPETWRKLTESRDHPLANRALMAQYPPGSTYKIVTAAAALEEGVITKDTPIYCPGHYTVGNRDYRCMRKEGHGWIRLKEALIQSCDVYFYHLGHLLGVDRLAKYARGFGLGAPTGFDPEQEKPGLIPTSAWKRKRFGAPWHAGETVVAAIGQGYDLVTPIQQFVMISAVANGGDVVIPQIVDRVMGPDGKPMLSFEPRFQGRLPLSSNNLKLLKEALRGVVHDPRGTGQRARVQGVDVAGKTGTAQVVRLSDRARERKVAVPYRHRDHAWFICFSPVENPQIAVVVVVEHGGLGGAEAAPVAQKVIQAFFQKQRS
ncbi:MAG: penicillin-binding protein 2 [Thermodesulfobacteriota bacterium]